jgi:hypothetical protein
MGAFKRMKDMKDMMHAAPGLIEQAREAGAQAQEMAYAQQAAIQAQMQARQSQVGGQVVDTSGPDFQPIAGVSLERYAEVSKGVAAYGYDQSKLVVVAAGKGIAEVDWEDAFQGWNERIKRNPVVAKAFNQAYRAAV